MKEPAGPRGVDDEARRQRAPAAEALGLETADAPSNVRPVTRVRSRVLGAFRVRPRAARNRSKSGRYQCVSATSSLGLAATRSWSLRSGFAPNGCPTLVRVEGEAALEAAGDLGTLALPAFPTRRAAGGAAGRSDRRAPRGAGWRAATTTRRWRSADARPRSKSTTRPSQAPGEERGERAGEAGPDDRDVERRRRAHASPQAAHTGAGRTACARRSSWRGARGATRGTPRSARARRGPRGPRRRGRASSRTSRPRAQSSRRPSVGGSKAPASRSASSAPLPPRVGISDTAVAPQSKRELDRAARPLPGLLRGDPRQPHQHEDAQCDASSATSASAARRKSSSVIRLLSRGSASGWTVSRPIATSSRSLAGRSRKRGRRPDRRATGATRR